MTENQRLKIIRLKLGNTQQQFADIVGLKQGSYADIERGKVNVSGNIKIALAKEFSINIDWLEKEEGEMFLQDHGRRLPKEYIKDIPQNNPGVGEPNKTDKNNNIPKPTIPMYNFPASASDIEMYSNPNEVKIIGYLSIPGSVKNSFALPVYGHSMYPTLENGSWCVLRQIQNKLDVDWGEIYYLEYGDYRQFKRLLKAEDDECVILWSDNQSEIINNRPKYAPKTIKLESIRKLCLLTDILKKPNY